VNQRASHFSDFRDAEQELVWSEEHPTRSSAMARERQVKAKKSARWIRENLLNGRVPTPSRD
jgi:predicted GIY-YIG superfamily endonuclease